MNGLTLTIRQLDAMRAHVEACLPQEGCGLLAGNGGFVQEVLPITNQAHSPVRFRMDPAEQLRAFDWIDRHGLELLGIFHSHPSGPEGPSATDIAEAAYPVVHIVWCRQQGGWKATGFWIADGRASEVKLYAADGD